MVVMEWSCGVLTRERKGMEQNKEVRASGSQSTSHLRLLPLMSFLFFLPNSILK
jgi:hypothetical protein